MNKNETLESKIKPDIEFGKVDEYTYADFLIDFNLKLNKLIEENKIKNDIFSLRINKLELGINNVYNEFKKLTDADFLRDFNLEKNKLIEEVKNLKVKVYKQEKYVNNCNKKISLIHDIYKLIKDGDDEFIRKTAKMLRIIHEEEYDND